MTKKEIAVNAVHAWKKEYPDAICSLVYTDPLQLLIATRLAAQCTDARVNMVTPSLFDRFKTAQDFIRLNQKILLKWQECFVTILAVLFPIILTI